MFEFMDKVKCNLWTKPVCTTDKPHRACHLVIEHVTFQLTLKECHSKCAAGQACVLPRPLLTEPIRLHMLTSSQGHIHGISAQRLFIWLNIYCVYHRLCPSHTHKQGTNIMALD